MSDRERARFAAATAVVAAIFFVAGVALTGVSTSAGYTLLALGALGAIQAVLIGLGLMKYWGEDPAAHSTTRPMRAETPKRHSDSPERRRARRRYAGAAGSMAAVLLIVGVVLARTASGNWRDLGVLCLGYGIGVAVAAAFLAFGYDPRRRK